jgi:hypothetical protein
MGFIDKMCYEVATTIIIDIFLTKYIPTIKDNISWYENLNTFIINEWNLQNTKNRRTEYTEIEENHIIRNAMDILLNKLNINDDDFKIHEHDINWLKFDDIIHYYLCIL